MILAPRSSKHSIPPSLLAAVRGLVPDTMVDHHRAPKRAKANNEFAPAGRLRMTIDETTGLVRRLSALERQSWDDGSINSLIYVPWPQRGDPCSNRFGVRVGRYQTLLGIDDAWDFCPGWGTIARSSDAYRGEDIISTMSRTWAATGKPKSVILERGVWEADRVSDFLRAAGVNVTHVYRSRTKLVENWWGRLWAELELEPGQIGRYRGELEAGNKLLRQLQSGSLDPREAGIPSMMEHSAALERAVGRIHRAQVESKIYGRWIPADQYAFELANTSPELLSGLDYHSAPNVHELTVKAGQVRCTVNHPLVGKLLFAFAWDEAWRWETARVRVYFDAAAPGEACTAAVVLRERFDGRDAGLVVCKSAPCVSMRPDWVPGEGLSWIDLGLSDASEVRKAQHSALVAAYRSLRPDGTRAGWASETRTPEGKREVVEVRTGGAAAPQNDSTPTTTDSTDNAAAPARATGKPRARSDAPVASRTAAPADPPPTRGQDPLLKLLGVEY